DPVREVRRRALRAQREARGHPVMNARTVRFVLLALAASVAAPVASAPTLKVRDYRGKVVVLGFGFTWCTDVCPVTLATLRQARSKLGPAAADVQVVYVTVDPERDSPARMKDYLHAFDPTFIGGTGGAAALAAVRKDYGIVAEKHVKGSSYSVAHSSYTYLIDRRGQLRALMPYGHSAEDYVHDLRILLAE